MKGMPSLLLENQGDATFVNAANKQARSSNAR